MASLRLQYREGYLRVPYQYGIQRPQVVDEGGGPHMYEAIVNILNKMLRIAVKGRPLSLKKVSWDSQQPPI
jgi:hypothetical protein